jgi:hypothetical protein
MNHEKGERDPFFDRYRNHTTSIVLIDAMGFMTVRTALDAGHLQTVTEGIYRPHGKQ